MERFYALYASRVLKFKTICRSVILFQELNTLYQKCDLDEAICNDDCLNEAYGFRQEVQKHLMILSNIEATEPFKAHEHGYDYSGKIKHDF